MTEVGCHTVELLDAGISMMNERLGVMLSSVEAWQGNDHLQAPTTPFSLASQQ